MFFMSPMDKKDYSHEDCNKINNEADFFIFQPVQTMALHCGR